MERLESTAKKLLILAQIPVGWTVYFCARH